MAVVRDCFAGFPCILLFKKWEHHLKLRVKIPMFLLVWVGCIALVKFANLACGFAIHRRLVSEHTVMNKICGGLLFAIPLCVGILPRPATDALIFLTCCCATAAAIREGRLIRAGKETT